MTSTWAAKALRGPAPPQAFLLGVRGRNKGGDSPALGAQAPSHEGPGPGERPEGVEKKLCSGGGGHTPPFIYHLVSKTYLVVSKVRINR